MKFNGKFVVVLAFLVLLFLPEITLADGHFLWEVERGGDKFFLLGSFHYLPEGSYPLADPIEEAFSQADCIAVEVDVTEISPFSYQALIQEYGLYTGDRTLEDDLPEELYKRVIDAGQKYGLLSNQINLFKPWLLGQAFADLTLSELEFEFEQGVEMYFLNRAHAKEMEVFELESVEEQLKLMAGFDLDVQIALIEDALDQDIKEVERSIKKALNDWRKGEMEGVKDFVFGGREEKPELEEFYWKVFEERNYHMADTIEELLKKDCLFFIIVGSGHVIGEHGLPEIFSDRGFEIKTF